MCVLSILSTQNLFYLDLSLSLVKPQSKHYKSLPLQIANACLISQNARLAYLALKEAYQIAHQSHNSFLPFSWLHLFINGPSVHPHFTTGPIIHAQSLRAPLYKSAWAWPKPEHTNWPELQIHKVQISTTQNRHAIQMFFDCNQIQDFTTGLQKLWQNLRRLFPIWWGGNAYSSHFLKIRNHQNGPPILFPKREVVKKPGPAYGQPGRKISVFWRLP